MANSKRDGLKYEVSGTKTTSAREQAQFERKQTLDRMNTMQIVWYLTQRHQTFLLTLMVALQFSYIVFNKLG